MGWPEQLTAEILEARQMRPERPPGAAAQGGDAAPLPGQMAWALPAPPPAEEGEPIADEAMLARAEAGLREFCALYNVIAWNPEYYAACAAGRPLESEAEAGRGEGLTDAWVDAWTDDDAAPDRAPIPGWPEYPGKAG